MRMSHNGSPRSRRRVVIVGGGFGGLAAARRLRHDGIEVTVVDRKQHHLFQPLLYQVAAGTVAPGECAVPIRVALRRNPHASVLMAEVVDFDVQSKEVVLERGERIPYDSLIVACGMETSYFGNDEWKDESCGLKTLADAVELRERVFGALEQAERETDPEARAEWLTFVVVGGGPTGVEVAGSLAILTEQASERDYATIRPGDARIVLVDAGDRVLSAFAESLSRKAAKGLAELGVTVRESARATAIDSHGLTVDADGETQRIPSRTVIWAAGVQAAPVTQALARATRSETDRAGRIPVNADLTIPGHPEISVIGDAANLEGPDGRPLPGLATVAIQQAAHVAKAIGSGRAGGGTSFRYLDKGALAVIGRGRAICQIKGMKLSGWPAFATYLGVHLFYLGSEGKRLRILTDWITAWFGVRGHQVIERELPAAESTRPPVEAAG
jgi:NADH dehydrogenase